MEQNFIENELIILTKATLDRFLKEENPADLIALYTFFYYTAKWQQTNIVKATQGYVKKGLHWGIDRLNTSEKKLIELGLIEKVTRKTRGKIDGWYIKVNYIFKKENVEIIQNTQKPQVIETTSGKQETNALSNSNINALSTNKEYIQEEVKEEDNKVTLPKQAGKTSHERLLYLYKKLFYKTYNVTYKPNYGKDYNIFKMMLANYSEIQVSYMLCVYFNWHGMTGNESKEYDFVTGSTFPITMFKTMINKFEIYSRNVMRIKFDDDQELFDKTMEIVL